MFNLSQNVQGFFLWFGASVSIAEIMTGTVLAGIDLYSGFFAIILGHCIGGLLFFGAGLIGAREKVSSMQSTRFAFGSTPALFFAFLNILQLIGWTAVMLQSGMAVSMDFLKDFISLSENNSIIQDGYVVILGLMIGIWLVSDIKGMNVFHTIIVFTLSVLSCMLLYKLIIAIFPQSHELVRSQENSVLFGSALDLSIVMPLSWLPLIADYTQHAKKSTQYTVVCSLAYFLGSCLMYIVGFLGAIYLDDASVANLFSLLGFGGFALFIIFFSTITTAYLDVYSAGESMQTITKKISRRKSSLLLLFISILAALLISSEYYQNFLYLIGSVFIPMAGILLTDYFLIKQNSFDKDINFINVIIWFLGFLFSRYLIASQVFSFGSSMPTLILVCLLKLAVYMILRKKVK